MGTISYTGRVINTERMPIQLGKGGQMTVLKATLAEQHQGKNGKAEKKYQDENKSPDDYVNTTTTWHKLTIFGAKAEQLAQDPNFNHGGLFEVKGAAYIEEDEWETRDGVKRAGRPETIGDKVGEISVLTHNGKQYGPREPKPALWDGKSDLPKIQGNGGPQKDREVREDEGF